jgi:hypothetical protein
MADLNQLLLPVIVPATTRAQRVRAGVRDKLRRTWDDRHDETGLDEAVTKMIWLAVGIAVAVAATTFFVGVFNDAQANVPDPVAPTP